MQNKNFHSNHASIVSFLCFFDIVVVTFFFVVVARAAAAGTQSSRMRAHIKARKKEEICRTLDEVEIIKEGIR